METKIKAIETEYNGYRFRSRLEARWAVFFDAANIKYQYEVEGFDLPRNGRYLPDFYLPDFDVYVEIKPTLSLGDETREETYKQQENLCSEFAWETRKPILLCRGTPWEDIWEELWIYDGEGTVGVEARFIDVSTSGEIYPILLTFGWGYKTRVCGAQEVIENYSEYVKHLVCEKMTEFYDHKGNGIDSAKREAQQARFEYGEHGRRTNNLDAVYAAFPKGQKM